MAAAATRPTTPTSFGFENLMDTFTVNIHRAEGRPLNVPLISPFTIATSRLVSVENVGIRIELTNGCVGWGEAPILPFVTAEDQPMVLGKTEETCEFLRQTHGRTLGMVLKEIGEFLPGHAFASVSLNETFKLFPPFYCASIQFYLSLSICYLWVKFYTKVFLGINKNDLGLPILRSKSMSLPFINISICCHEHTSCICLFLAFHLDRILKGSCV